MYNKTPLCSTLAEVEAMFRKQPMVLETTDSLYDTTSEIPGVLFIDSRKTTYCGKNNFVAMSLVANKTETNAYLQITQHIEGRDDKKAIRYDISSACDMYEKMLNEVTSLGRFCDFLTGFEPVIEEDGYICVVPNNLSGRELHKAWEMYQMLCMDALQTAAKMMLPVDFHEYLPLYKIKKELPLPALYVEVIDKSVVQWKIWFEGELAVDVPGLVCDKTYAHIEYEVNQVLMARNQKNIKEGEASFDEVVGAIIFKKNGCQYSFSIQEIEKMFVLREAKDYVDELECTLKHYGLPDGYDRSFLEALRNYYIRLRKNGMKKEDAIGHAMREVLFKTTGRYYATEYVWTGQRTEDIKFPKLTGIEIATGPCTTETLSWEEVDKILAVASKL